MFTSGIYSAVAVKVGSREFQFDMKKIICIDVTALTPFMYRAYSRCNLAEYPMTCLPNQIPPNQDFKPSKLVSKALLL